MQLGGTCLIGNVWSRKRSNLEAASWAGHQIAFQVKDSLWLEPSVWLGTGQHGSPPPPHPLPPAGSRRLARKQFSVGLCFENLSFQFLNTPNTANSFLGCSFRVSLSFSFVCLFVGLGLQLWLPGVLRHRVPVVGGAGPKVVLVCVRTGPASVHSHLVPDMLGCNELPAH